MVEYKRVEYTIPRSILGASGVSEKEISYALQTLFDTFHDIALDFIGKEISSSSQILILKDLSDLVIELKVLPGFDKWVSTFKPGQFESSLFVARSTMAFKPYLKELELEPALKSGRVGDFTGYDEGEKIYFECKHRECRLNDYLPDHIEIANKIFDKIDTHHQISLTYATHPTETELDGLISTISERLNSVRASGDIILNQNYRVNVEYRNQPNATNQSSFIEEVILGFNSLDTRSQNVYPGHCLLRSGRTVAIEGPKLKVNSAIKDVLKRSSLQAPDDAAYILIIDAQSLYGNYGDLIKHIYKELQPDQNTRFSGVIIANALPNFQEQFLEYISNPFAKFPLHKHFSNIISEINRNKKKSKEILSNGIETSIKG